MCFFFSCKTLRKYGRPRSTIMLNLYNTHTHTYTLFLISSSIITNGESHIMWSWFSVKTLSFIRYYICNIFSSYLFVLIISIIIGIWVGPWLIAFNLNKWPRILLCAKVVIIKNITVRIYHWLGWLWLYSHSSLAIQRNLLLLEKKLQYTSVLFLPLGIQLSFILGIRVGYMHDLSTLEYVSI